MRPQTPKSIPSTRSSTTSLTSSFALWTSPAVSQVPLSSTYEVTESLGSPFLVKNDFTLLYVLKTLPNFRERRPCEARFSSSSTSTKATPATRRPSGERTVSAVRSASAVDPSERCRRIVCPPASTMVEATWKRKWLPSASSRLRLSARASLR